MMANTMATKTLQARLDPQSKRAVEEAAKLRRVGLSDYIRLVLEAPANPSKAQCELGKSCGG